MTLPAAEFLDTVRRLHLVETTQLDELTRNLQGKNVDVRALAQKMVEHGWLTPFQVKQLWQGNSQQLLLGSYVVQDCLGEGGMGYVYKASHKVMGRTVALKVIRKEKMTSPTIVKRFQQEIRVISQMAHPNIVAAYDSGQAGDTHYFAMEYVDGIDLRRLVKDNGPLPLADACDYIRQAALGLQHAHEHGFVHRDIKPGNLMLAKVRGAVSGGVVKILDMGLARLDMPEENNAGLTRIGTLVGTPDYLAPEQAKDPKVDIRADLYSLGCTFYFLLVGQPPFRGDSLPELLLKHQTEAPLSVVVHRPDVPMSVQAIMKKLLAKRPEDRYQTPAELAAALAAAVPARPKAPASTARIAKETKQWVPLPTPAYTKAPRRSLKKRLLLPITAGGFLVGALILALTLGSAFQAGSQPESGKVVKATAVRPADTARSSEAPKSISNAAGLKLVPIQAGKFLMGSSVEDIERARKEPHRSAQPDWERVEGPQHSVTITKGFYMGIYAVTQSQFEKVMGRNPAGNKESPDHPVELVNWNDAVEFCKKLSELPEEKKAGRVYRLPTEAEWEYACRAGSAAVFSCGNSLTSRQANFKGEFPFGTTEQGPRIGKTVKVGSYSPNAWGLYDMHGNVAQWCLDGQRQYTADAVQDPRGPEAPGSARALRGGDWSASAWNCRSACRKARDPSNYHTNRTGFRVVCER